MFPKSARKTVFDNIEKVNNPGPTDYNRQRMFDNKQAIDYSKRLVSLNPNSSGFKTSMCLSKGDRGSSQGNVSVERKTSMEPLNGRGDSVMHTKVDELSDQSERTPEGNSGKADIPKVLQTDR